MYMTEDKIRNLWNIVEILFHHFFIPISVVCVFFSTFIIRMSNSFITSIDTIKKANKKARYIFSWVTQIKSFFLNLNFLCSFKTFQNQLRFLTKERRPKVSAYFFFLFHLYLFALWSIKLLMPDTFHTTNKLFFAVIIETIIYFAFPRIKNAA